MRQLFIYTPRDDADRVRTLAERHDAINLLQLEGTDGHAPVNLTVLHVSNHRVGDLLEQLGEIEEARISFFPTGVLALKPPVSEAPSQVRDVEARSPIEVFLGGHQSIGAWRGFLGYAAVAGVVVWIGLFTNTAYLLTAAMLIAPFAGPAMNAAIATAAGEGVLLRRSLIRYAAALGVTVGVAFLLTLILGQEVATPQMIARSQISRVAVLLPLAAGCAGGLNLVQSERSSLVAGAAVGMLVAASLAPPAGVLGMAAAIGRWDMVQGMAYQQLLQLAGINLAGALVFRLFGLSAERARYEAGHRWLFPAGVATTLVVLAALLTWQFTSPVSLERSSLEQRVTHAIQQTVEAQDDLAFIETTARFTRPNTPGPPTLLSDVYVQRMASATAPDEALRGRLTQAIQQRIRRDWPDMMPLVNVSVLSPPDAAAP